MVLNKVVLTGASGMVGRHVLAALKASGISVIASSRTRPFNLSVGAEWTPWDLCEWKHASKLDSMFRGADALIHAGAAVPRSGLELSGNNIFDANVRSCLCLGEWAVRRNLPIVYISGATVYADPERGGIKEDAAKTCAGLGGFYGFTKLLAENVFSHLQSQGLRICILRPSSIYGEGLPEGKMIADFLAAARQDKPIELTPPTDDRIDLVHAFDVACAALSALEKEAWGTFNVASEAPVTVEKIASVCVKTVGRGHIAVIDRLANRPANIRFGLDCSAARSRFGYMPHISLEEGIDMMLRKVVWR